MKIKANKVMAVFMALLMMFTALVMCSTFTVKATEITTDSEETTEKYDLNADGLVDCFDMILLRKEVITKDSDFKIADLVCMEKWLLGTKDTIEGKIVIDELDLTEWENIKDSVINAESVTVAEDEITFNTSIGKVVALNNVNYRDTCNETAIWLIDMITVQGNDYLVWKGFSVHVTPANCTKYIFCADGTETSYDAFRYLEFENIAPTEKWNDFLKQYMTDIYSVMRKYGSIFAFGDRTEIKVVNSFNTKTIFSLEAKTKEALSETAEFVTKVPFMFSTMEEISVYIEDGKYILVYKQKS